MRLALFSEPAPLSLHLLTSGKHRAIALPWYPVLAGLEWLAGSRLSSGPQNVALTRGQVKAKFSSGQKYFLDVCIIITFEAIL